MQPGREEKEKGPSPPQPGTIESSPALVNKSIPKKKEPSIIHRRTFKQKEGVKKQQFAIEPSFFGNDQQKSNEELWYLPILSAPVRRKRPILPTLAV